MDCFDISGNPLCGGGCLNSLKPNDLFLLAIRPYKQLGTGNANDIFSSVNDVMAPKSVNDVVTLNT